jgi:hypothetical protein
LKKARHPLWIGKVMMAGCWREGQLASVESVMTHTGFQRGSLVVSLDFELFWGVRDKKKLSECGQKLLGERCAVPRLLRLFEKYGVHATWAVVGFLFFQTREQLLKGLPAVKPSYSNTRFTPYRWIDRIGNDEQSDPYHFAPSLVRMISSTPYQEIATHTLSHYYCLEKGQTGATFRADLEAAIRIADQMDLPINSIVFPRNQVNPTYLPICRELGIDAYRGNERFWVYAPIADQAQSWSRRGLRLLDSYINISGHNAYRLENNTHHSPLNIPSSRYLRPYCQKLKHLELFKRYRILSDLKHAADNGLLYHLWWHPQDFGVHFDENFRMLEKILHFFHSLSTHSGMLSLNMGEAAKIVQ